MADSLTHRGPDDGDTWVDPSAGVGLAHRRLAILDLSPTGHQPMVSACGRYVIAYNGELYNVAEIRDELAASGATFRGHSDTEVLLEACARWGVRAAARRSVGMFAFALWDRHAGTLTLVRDQVGIKPLYWGRCGGGFVFASELKALRHHPDWRPDIDRDALTAYLRHNYIPAPRTVYQGLFKLRPGHMVVLTTDGAPQEDAFWSLDEAVHAGRDNPFRGTEAEATDALEAVLSDAVGRQMLSDVPLGAFLSGGIDSSTVVALMQARSASPVNTFSIGFHEAGFNEAGYAADVARHLGTDHTELYVTPAEARDVIPALPEMYDEPFADSSQIPTHLVSALARRHVTVALSGDGGDELFCGYVRYFQAERLRSRLTAVPAPLRRAAGTAIGALPQGGWDALFRLLPAGRRPSRAGESLHDLARLARADDGALYQRLVSQWLDPDRVVIGATEPASLLRDPKAAGLLPDYRRRLQYLDTLTYLPDDILTKVDRASMAVSLECRVPLLDQRVVEFAWRLPDDLLVRDDAGKWILRQVLARHVPRSLFERPKVGFGVPIGEWLRGPLRDWAEDLLDAPRLAADGIFDPGPIRRRWTEHLSGRADWNYLLWTVIMFQAWWRANRP